MGKKSARRLKMSHTSACDGKTRTRHEHFGFPITNPIVWRDIDSSRLKWFRHYLFVFLLLSVCSASLPPPHWKNRIVPDWDKPPVRHLFFFFFLSMFHSWFSPLFHVCVHAWLQGGLIFLLLKSFSLQICMGVHSCVDSPSFGSPFFCTTPFSVSPYFTRQTNPNISFLSA